MPVVRAFPVRVKTLATFTVPDPWNDLTLAGFTIEAHVLGPEHPVTPR